MRDFFEKWIFHVTISLIIGFPIIILIIILINSLFSILDINSFLKTNYGFGLLLLCSIIFGIKISEHLSNELTKYLRDI